MHVSATGNIDRFAGDIIGFAEIDNTFTDVGWSLLTPQIGILPDEAIEDLGKGRPG